ncbi:MAG: SDR family NAD(P)-dependent oxidoreductase [Pseudomonadota bacterium]
MKPVCLVIGAGAGIGGTVGKKFAAEGYHAALARRSDEEGLAKLVGDIEASGGSASGHMVNAVKENEIEDLIASVKASHGPIEVLIYNLGAQIGDRTLAETSYKAFERCWQMATFGLFRAAQCLMPDMVEAGQGTFIVTSATAAMRGNKGQHAHASAMGGRRMLCQSLSAQFASQGVHIAHVMLDGMVDAPDTLGRMMGAENFQKLRETRGAEDQLIMPEKLAETYWHLHKQHRSTWTHELDVRSYSDLAWFNH